MTTMVRFQLARIATAVLLGTASATLAATPAEKCEQGKNLAAGKYAACRQKAEAKFALTADETERAETLDKCVDKYTTKWPMLESKAANAGDVCPSVGDQGQIQGMIDAQATNIATALAGGVVEDCSADLATCEGDLATCEGEHATCESELAAATYQPNPGLPTTIVGTPVVDPSCSGQIDFNVNVQADDPGAGQPVGSFFLQCVGGPCPSGIGVEPVWPTTGGGPSASASFRLSVGAVVAPATVAFRIGWVPKLDYQQPINVQYHFISLPSPFRASSILYDVHIPGGASCPTVSPVPFATEPTFIQTWDVFVESTCIYEHDDFTYVVHPQNRFFGALNGTMLVECIAPISCPPEVQQTYRLVASDPVSRRSGTASLGLETFHGDWQGNFDSLVLATFVPDDPQRLPSRVLHKVIVTYSPACPASVDNLVCTNGAPGIPPTCATEYPPYGSYGSIF